MLLTFLSLCNNRKIHSYIFTDQEDSIVSVLITVMKQLHRDEALFCLATERASVHVVITQLPSKFPPFAEFPYILETLENIELLSHIYVSVLHHLIPF